MFRDFVLGYKHISEIDDEPSNNEQDTNQERIRNNLLTVKDKTDKDVKRCESVTSQINDASAKPHKRTITWADVVSSNR